MSGRYGVVTESAPGVTTGDTLNGEPGALEDAMYADSLDCVLATSRSISARCREHRRDAKLIETYG